jgi:hypothetical protein
MSSVLNPIQSWRALSSAITLLAAVCETTPGLTSLKMRLVMAWRMSLRTFISSTLTAFEISANVAVEPTGKAFAARRGQRDILHWQVDPIILTDLELVHSSQ